HEFVLELSEMPKLIRAKCDGNLMTAKADIVRTGTMVYSRFWFRFSKRNQRSFTLRVNVETIPECRA
ncbi:hypothetical protein, partial [Bradyrhizobium sp.]|uniref:hypothetical protein n=1 Tax=Bradyrhizobium sp. TaxID=376 RepID=UPI0025BED4B6